MNSTLTYKSLVASRLRTCEEKSVHRAARGKPQRDSPSQPLRRAGVPPPVHVLFVQRPSAARNPPWKTPGCGATDEMRLPTLTSMKRIARLHRQSAQRGRTARDSELPQGRTPSSRQHVPLLATALCLALPVTVIAEPCWEQAASRFGIAKELLYAVARTESSLDAQAVNRSHMQRTTSYDIGLMQINSRHLARLASMGIAEDDLLDACVNLEVGAWLLADLFDRHGASWNAVGAYNAACTQLKGQDCARARATYAWKVYRHLPTATSVTAPAAPSDGPNAAQHISVRVAP